VLSLLVGALVGLVVVAFILLTGRLAAHMYPEGGAGWRRVLVPTLGALGSGILLHRFFPDARGSGIPQTRAAIYIHDGRITFKTVIGKFVCCCASLASGIALGREGPSVHIGAGIGSVIARRLGLSTAQVRWLVPVGAAAALALGNVRTARAALLAPVRPADEDDAGERLVARASALGRAPHGLRPRRRQRRGARDRARPVPAVTVGRSARVLTRRASSRTAERQMRGKPRKCRVAQRRPPARSTTRSER